MGFFTNSIPGREGDQYRTSSVQNHALGTLMVFDDGRFFRYARNGASAGAAGKLAQRTVPTANHVNLTTAAVAVGDTTVTVTLGATAVTADMYKDGFLVFEDASGQGYSYRIAEHAAVASAGTFAVPLVVPGGAKVAATSSAKTSLIKNGYADIIIHPSPPTEPVAGVWTTDLAASYYGWVQTRGLASVLQDGALTAGRLVMASDAVDGAVEAMALAEGTPNTQADYLSVGQCIRNTGDTKYATIFLTIE